MYDTPSEAPRRPQEPPELVKAVACMHAAVDALDALADALDGHECTSRPGRGGCDWCTLMDDAEKVSWLVHTHLNLIDGETAERAAVEALHARLVAVADRFCSELPPFGSAGADEPVTAAAAPPCCERKVSR